MDHLAQRLWVLERQMPPSRPGGEDACRFVGAVTILDDSVAYVIFVRSSVRQRASEVVLREVTFRLNIERDAFRFPTLDDAILWVDVAKQGWLSRGWTEVPAGANDH